MAIAQQGDQHPVDKLCLAHDQIAGVRFELLKLFYEAHWYSGKVEKACHCSDDALAGQPVACIFDTRASHVPTDLGNNDPLYDHESPKSLQNNPKKSTRMRHWAWIVTIVATLPAMGQDAVDADDLSTAFDSSTIIIEAEEDACYRFDVYLATSRDQQVRGLMHVRHLPVFSGMLFGYTEANIRSMWMKNTYISLDILFIREDGTIANIEANTEPLSLKSISSTEPVRYVLELNAGVTSKLNIGTGSLIHLQLSDGI
jgi:uncharacterized membrane protein (UPF0127 family)